MTVPFRPPPRRAPDRSPSVAARRKRHVTIDMHMTLSAPARSLDGPVQPTAGRYGRHRTDDRLTGQPPRTREAGRLAEGVFRVRGLVQEGVEAGVVARKLVAGRKGGDKNDERGVSC